MRVITTYLRFVTLLMHEELSARISAKAWESFGSLICGARHSCQVRRYGHLYIGVAWTGALRNASAPSEARVNA